MIQYQPQDSGEYLSQIDHYVYCLVGNHGAGCPTYTALDHPERHRQLGSDARESSCWRGPRNSISRNTCIGLDA